MTPPIEVDLPHKLGTPEAKKRIGEGFGKLADFVPGGAVTEHRWSGDTLFFTVEGMGQRIGCKLDIADTNVHALFELPPLLALFADRIRTKLEKEGPKLLE